LKSLLKKLWPGNFEAGQQVGRRRGRQTRPMQRNSRAGIDPEPFSMIDKNRRSLDRKSPYRAFALSIGVVTLGIVVGSTAAIIGGNFSQADATRFSDDLFDLSNAPSVVTFEVPRPVLSEYQLLAPERLSPWTNSVDARSPKIVIIFDDMGLDKTAFETVMSYPGPVTVSFLPYAKNVQEMVNKARADGDGVLLHLPMEPEGSADPGPHALKTGLPGLTLLQELNWNLSQFTGFTGVNNHMGSRFTQSEAHMKTILSVLKERDLYFLDSVTTGKSSVPVAAAATGIETLYRDIFLDAHPGEQNIRAQLARLEKIARKTGFAVAICHPRKETLNVVGPWLTSAPARGFELATLDELRLLTSNTALLAEK